MTTARERTGWALLFGLPMGAGVGLATARMARTDLADPLVVGSTVATAALLSAFVLGATGVAAADDAAPGANDR